MSTISVPNRFPSVAPCQGPDEGDEGHRSRGLAIAEICGVEQIPTGIATNEANAVEPIAAPRPDGSVRSSKVDSDHNQQGEDYNDIITVWEPDDNFQVKMVLHPGPPSPKRAAMIHRAIKRNPVGSHPTVD